MSKVVIVTDSTAYIPPELSKGLPIRVVPLQLIWGEETFLDGVDIQPSEFYTRLPQAKVMPTTSQPTPAAYIALYRQLLDEGYEIVSAHISSKLSGTMDSAIQAKSHYPGEKIELIDTDTTSMAMGFPVLGAARAAAEGATLEECKTLIERGAANSGVLFAVNTLEFLRRGGRIGGAAAFLGTALNLKPILELRSGKIEPVERVRTMSKSIDRMLDVFMDRIGDRKPVRIAALHANAPQEASKLLERAIQCFSNGDVTEHIVTDVSPVIGAHTGPGCIGLCYQVG